MTELELNSIVHSALSMHQQGRLDEAETAYRRVLDIEPRHFDANQLQGMLYIAKCQFVQAEHQLRLAIELNSGHAIVHNNHCAALLALERFDEALVSADKAIDLYPRYPEALFNRGLALEKIGRAIEAVQSYEKSLSLRPDYQLALTHRARLMREIGSEDHMNPKLNQVHPIDLQYDIDTSGYATHAYPPGVTREITTGYAAVQPSIVRQLLEMTPDLADYAFFDLGCGKGRALVVASEFPFRRICGVEISPDLAAVATANAAAVRKVHPERTPIEIVEGNAVDISMATGKIILFLYNPFGLELIDQLADNIRAALRADIDHLYVIYHNAKESPSFDGCGALMRCFAGLLEADPNERPFGYAVEGGTVIWQSKRGLNVHAALNWAAAQFRAGRHDEVEQACTAILAVEAGHLRARGMLDEVAARKAAQRRGLPGLQIGGPLSLNEQIRKAIEKPRS